MIVPQYWAEARSQHRKGKQRVTVRRFGWSDESQEAAQAHADARVREAMEQVLAGKETRRLDHKIPYNGAEGLPIREEIVDRHGDVVITRNSYGALCLNTPDVLFADIDFEDPGPSARLYGWSILSMVMVAIAIGIWRGSILIPVILIIPAVLIGQGIAIRVQRSLWARGGGPELRAQQRLDAFLQSNPDWRISKYSTPGGLRLLALHRTFTPNEPAVQACFDALGADGIYALMCKRQSCFRARLTPKPWRIGIHFHMRPRPGVWPVKTEHLEGRHRWIREYEHASVAYAACRYVGEAGDGAIDEKADEVRKLHDRLCKAREGLAIA